MEWAGLLVPDHCLARYSAINVIDFQMPIDE
jgi:hypothetical protein